MIGTKAGFVAAVGGQGGAVLGAGGLLRSGAARIMTRGQLEAGIIRQPVEMAAMFGREGLLDLMERLSAPLPGDLPAVVPVWRGGANVTAPALATGLHWTLRRDVACKYAIERASDLGGNPLVIRANVRRESIVFHSDAWLEDEIAFRGAPLAVVVDGARPDWEAAAEACKIRHAARWLEVLQGGACTPLQRFCLRDRLPELGLPLSSLEAVIALDLRDAAAAALATFALPKSSIHGPAHWLRVLRNGRAIVARTPEADGFVVDLFALLHDCRRRDDGHDFGHGLRAAQHVETLARTGALLLDQRQMMALITACAAHEHGRTSPDPTVGACWDADRLDLSRLGRRPIASLLSTDAARDPDVQAGAWARGQGGDVDPGLDAALGLEPVAAIQRAGGG